MALPSLHLEGALVADPEIRFGQSGTAVAKIRVAASRRAKAEDGTWYDRDTAFLDVKIFADMGEHAAGSLKKGDLVTVTGTILTEEWTNGEGQKRSRLMVIADSIGPSMRFRTFEHHDRSQKQEAQEPTGATEEPPPF